MRPLAFLAALVLLAITTLSADAATRYVRKTGNDSNSGATPALAWLTIDHAANTLVAGDTVYVGAGTYSETITPNNDGTSPNPIRYIADTNGTYTGDAGSVIITSSGSVTLDVTGDQYAQFTGFMITGGTGRAVRTQNAPGFILQSCEVYSSGGVGVTIDNSDSSVLNCSIHNNTTLGIDVVAGCAVTVRDCTITSNGTSGIEVLGNASNALTAQRNILRSNGAYGINLNQGTHSVSNCLITGSVSGGIQQGTASAAVTTIWHCTLNSNTGAGIRQNGGTVNFRNSIVANSTTYGLYRTGGTMTHTYNCVYNNTSGNFNGTSASTGEVQTDPKFWSATCLELQDSSPCLNTGTNPGGAVTDDLDAVARPIGGSYDMGCYETTPLSYTSLVNAYTLLSPYAWWRLNETSGGTADDAIGSLDGTYQNGVVLNVDGVPIGNANKAAEFDGNNDKVNLATINPTVTKMSFIGWLRADDFDVANADILAKASGTSDSNYYWSLGTNTSSGQSRLHFRFRAGGSTSVITASSGGLSTGTWVFVAGVYDGQAIIVYKDGMEVGRTTKTGTPDLSGATNAAIGDNPTGSRPFDGRLDEVAIFTKALKPREIAAIHAAALKGSFDGSVSKPKMWGVDEDDSNLVSFTDYLTPSTITTFGKLKWNNSGVNTDFGTDFNISSSAISRQGRLYLTCDSNFGSNTAPTLMSFELANASTSQPNVVTIVGHIPTSTEIRGLAIDPVTAELYALRSDGWLYVVSTTDASIVRTVGQITGMSESVTTGEDICFDPYGNLYALDDTDDEIYRVSKANAAILEVYNNGGSLGVPQGMAWDHLNSKLIVSVTDARTFAVFPSNISGYSTVSGLATYGVTDLESISFVPTEGITGVGAGIRVLSWKEIK